MHHFPEREVPNESRGTVIRTARKGRSEDEEAGAPHARSQGWRLMTQGLHGAAVVGARGFLGAAIAAKIAATGDTVPEYDRAMPFIVDGELDPELGKVRTVIWAASSINPQIAAEQPERIADDRDAFADFLDRLESVNPAARVVLLSSGGTVYGEATSLPFTEDSPTRPISAYGRAKVALETLLESRSSGDVVARIANAYGPGQALAPGQGVIGHWLRAVLREEPTRVYGSLELTRDYVHVDDICEAIRRIHASHDVLPRIINIGSGTPTTLAEVAEVIGEVTGVGQLAIQYEGGRSIDVSSSWLDIALARRALDWSPRTGLRDGVASMWNWLTSDASR